MSESETDDESPLPLPPDKLLDDLREHVSAMIDVQIHNHGNGEAHVSIVEIMEKLKFAPDHYVDAMNQHIVYTIYALVGYSRIPPSLQAQCAASAAARCASTRACYHRAHLPECTCWVGMGLPHAWRNMLHAANAAATTIALATSTDDENVTLLHIACGRGAVDEVGKLLILGADYCTRDTEWHRTPMHYALMRYGGRAPDDKTSVRILRMLLRVGSRVDAITEDGFTPLYYAVQNDLDECADLLLRMGAYTHEKSGEEGSTVLGLAIIKGNLRFARLILKNGANVDAMTFDEWAKCVAVARRKEAHDIIGVLSTSVYAGTSYA